MITYHNIALNGLIPGQGAHLCQFMIPGKYRCNNSLNKRPLWEWAWPVRSWEYEVVWNVQLNSRLIVTKHRVKSMTLTFWNMRGSVHYYWILKKVLTNSLNVKKWESVKEKIWWDVIKGKCILGVKVWDSMEGIRVSVWQSKIVYEVDTGWLDLGVTV